MLVIALQRCVPALCRGEPQRRFRARLVIFAEEKVTPVGDFLAWLPMSRKVGLALIACLASAASFSARAQLETISYTINGATTSFSYTLNTSPWSQAISLPSLPAYTASSPSDTVTLSDQFQTPLGAATPVTDYWEFTISPSIAGTSFSGDQINLSNFQVSGMVETVSLYEGSTPGTGTLLSAVSTAGGISVYDLSQATNYYLQVNSTVQANSTGSYSVQMVTEAMPVPEPSSLRLALAGLTGVGLLVFCKPRLG